MDQRKAKNSHMLRLRKTAVLLPRIGNAGRLALLAWLVLPSHHVAAADRFPASPPLPVPRPRFEEQAPSTAAIPKPESPVVSAPAPDSERLPTELPANDPIVRLEGLPREEQRDVLRRCASEWDRMKREGTTRGMIWRDFLDSCLPDH